MASLSTQNGTGSWYRQLWGAPLCLSALGEEGDCRTALHVQCQGGHRQRVLLLLEGESGLGVSRYHSLALLASLD